MTSYSRNWFTLLLLCTSAPLVSCCDWFDRGSRQVKREPVDCFTLSAKRMLMTRYLTFCSNRMVWCYNNNKYNVKCAISFQISMTRKIKRIKDFLFSMFSPLASPTVSFLWASNILCGGGTSVLLIKRYEKVLHFNSFTSLTFVGCGMWVWMNAWPKLPIG